MLLLTESDLAEIFTLHDVIDIAERVYREQGDGAVTALPRQALRGRNCHVSIAGGLLDDSGIVALRMSVGTETGARDAALVFDANTAELLSVLDYQFSPERTAGMIGTATRALAAPSASVLCMIGAGRRAADYLRAVCLVRPISVIRVFSRSEEPRTRFAHQMSAELDRTVISAPDIDSATTGADIVLVSTNSRDPVLTAASLGGPSGHGQLVASMGRVPELDSSVYLAADEVFVSDRARVLRADGNDDASSCQLVHLLADSKISSEQIHEVGDVLRGDVAPSSRTEGITVFKDFAGGNGFGDAALSFAAFQRCRERGIGESIELHSVLDRSEDA